MLRAMKTTPFIVPVFFVASLACVTTACSADTASADNCEGAPWGHAMTLSPGPPVHAGYYSPAECQQICTFTNVCAPTIYQGSQPRYRWGAAPAASCGDRHMPRPNLPGPCDVDGKTVEIGAQFRADIELGQCVVACGPFIRVCTVHAFGTAAEVGNIGVRCGEPLPAGCAE
jgi:hypothetical protein